MVQAALYPTINRDGTLGSNPESRNYVPLISTKLLASTTTGGRLMKGQCIVCIPELTAACGDWPWRAALRPASLSVSQTLKTS